MRAACNTNFWFLTEMWLNEYPNTLCWLLVSYRGIQFNNSSSNIRDTSLWHRTVTQLSCFKYYSSAFCVQRTCLWVLRVWFARCYLVSLQSLLCLLTVSVRLLYRYLKTQGAWLYANYQLCQCLIYHNTNGKQPCFRLLWKAHAITGILIETKFFYLFTNC